MQFKVTDSVGNIHLVTSDEVRHSAGTISFWNTGTGCAPDKWVAYFVNPACVARA